MDKPEYDLIIIGAGPAGVQAAIHAGRRKARTLMLGRPQNSALYGAHIENYAFVPGVADGAKLLSIGMEQVQKSGVARKEEDVLHIEQTEDYFKIGLESGTTTTSYAIIFAMGVTKKKLGVTGEKEMSGQGVSYCVDCDANFYRGVPVAVTGNQSAAIDGAITLTDYASEVYLITDKLDANPEIIDKLAKSSVKHITPAKITSINGSEAVESVSLDNNDQLEVEGVFIELGSKGALELATQIGVALDTEYFKFIQTNKQMETNIAGVYAAGDITGYPHQMAVAVGEGCIAGMNAATYGKKKRRA